MSLEMAHKVIVPPKKNYIPQFLKQRDINSYFSFRYLQLLTRLSKRQTFQTWVGPNSDEGTNKWYSR
jgi:hypothetical protein